MLIWHASELHAHTVHSDGDFTVRELLAQAREAGYDTIALTDHNTISGVDEFLRTAPEFGLNAIRGMEWSTFFGHMVTLGAKYYVDWHGIGVNDIHKGIAQVHEAGGICGIAHPFTIGEPYCMGCHWHFKVADWNHPDYIEVWNDWWPSLELSNDKAYRFWTDRLNEGYRIYAASGRDWHNDERPHASLPVTFVGIEDDRFDDYEAGWLEGVRKGRIAVSFGPLPLMTLSCGSRSYGLGDTIDRRSLSGQAAVNITLDFERRRRVYTLDPDPLTLSVVGGAGELWSTDIGPERREGLLSFEAEIETADLKWVRCELRGSMEGKRQLVAFTNPIFIG